MEYQPIAQLGKDILSAARNELYLAMRFLDVPLAGLGYEISPVISSTATDGETLYVQPKYLLSSYEENPVLVNRAYLHNLLHCIFSHLYLPAKESKELWDLCCDICVEAIIDSLSVPCLQKMQSPIREQTYRLLEDNKIFYTPGRLYLFFEKHVFYHQNMLFMEQDFCIDSHALWKRDGGEESKKQQEKKWKEISEKTKTNMETFYRRAGNQAGKLLELLQITTQEEYRYDYFLKRFAAWRENLKINEDEFDVNYYTLGLDLYGNTPLLEPLEYKEEKKIKELVIAVDTSGSCRGNPVRRFLMETYGILKHSRYFFRQSRIHLLQFDTIIQEDLCITDFEQFFRLAESFQVKGFGGTDYRCVFDYIEKQQKNGGFSGLQGLMILTDGYGTYPEHPPAYPTAFLLADFLKETPSHALPAYDRVPHWAIRLRIDEAEEKKDFLME
ncbi:MAG: metallopeptidase [Lachnospiraceae bacterium]|nr:metallopeptidase [Lachnospiraceae bacterium]